MSELKFSIPIAVLLEQAGEVHENLEGDLPEFQAFDPDLNPDKQKALHDNVMLALETGTDKTQLSALIRKTMGVKAEMAACEKLFKTVRYFLEKKHANNPALIKQFRILDYNKIRNNQKALVVYMFELAKNAETHQQLLMDAGMKEAEILAIRPAAEALSVANKKQESGKGQRKLSTAERHTVLNDIYDILMEFNKAAKLVFEDDPIRRERYAIPYTYKNDSTDDAGVDEEDESLEPQELN